MVHWKGEERQAISEELDSTLRGVLDDTADEGLTVEPKARAILLCLDEIAHEFHIWLRNASLQLSKAPPEGSANLRESIKRLRKQLSKSSLPLPPPIQTLRSQGVPIPQIARIYGWKTPDGAGDAQKVYEEIEKPGTHFKKDAWVHPSEIRRNAEIAVLWERRETRRPDRRSAQRSDDTPAPEPVVPTLDELIQHKAPIGQIMHLTGKSQEYIEQKAAEAGVQLTTREIKPANAVVAHQERMAAEEAARANAAQTT